MTSLAEKKNPRYPPCQHLSHWAATKVCKNAHWTNVVGEKFNCHIDSEHKHWFDRVARRGTKCRENSAANCPRCHIGSTLMSTSVWGLGARGCARWGVGASVSDRRGGHVSQPSQSNADDPRCISIESLTRQAPPPPPSRPLRPTHFQTIVWQDSPCHGGLDDGAESRGQTARASGCKQNENDQDRQGREGGWRGVRSSGVGEGTYLALPLCCRIVAFFFATVTVGMNHSVTHILLPGSVHSNRHGYLASTHSKQEPLNDLFIRMSFFFS